MANAAADEQAQGIVNFATGTITGDGTVTNVLLGFKPRHVRVFNETDVIVWEKFATQADANTVKLDATPALTKDTTSAIKLVGDQGVDSFAGFILTAAVAANAKVLHWAAWG